MAYDFGTGTLTPTPSTVYTTYGCGDTRQGQIQVSPDGGKLGWWRYDTYLSGFSYRSGEIHNIPITARHTAINGSVTIMPISQAGSYGNGMLEFMKNSTDVLYSQRGVYKEGTNPNEYDRNVWKYDPIQLTALSINPNTTPLISYLFGEIKRGTDGNYYIPNMSKAVDKVHSYNGGSWNSNSTIADTMYKLTSSLPTQVFKVFDASAQIDEFNRSIGNKSYELKDHLGNVRVVVSDAKQIVSVSTNSAIVDNGDTFEPEVLNFSDYYAFGQLMPGRQFNSSDYRYGFNGKENDNEVKGAGNQQDYGMRIYDPRLGKFLSVDPLTKKYPELTPYQFASNTPIQAVDLDGLEAAPSVGGYMASFSGYDPNTPNQTGVAKQVLSDFKDVMSKPETYADAAMAIGQGVALVAITMPLEGIGGPFMLSKYEMPAVSTSVKSSALEVEVPFIFRGDGRAPAEIFETGFTSKGNNMNLFEHAKTNPPNSGFISTSTKTEPAMEAAQTNQGYVYKIENNPALKGVDVNKTLGTKSPHPTESEIAIPYKIPNTSVQGAQAVTPSGEYTGTYFPNPNYTPTNTTPKK